jgi:hypothetical protein
MITTRSSYRDAAGFDLSGYDQAGYDRAGYDRQGYGKNGFNKEGFNKEGYTIGGSFYDTTGYDKDGYDKKGYDRAGFSRSGYKRWSPISSYFEFLVYNTYSAWMGNDEDPGLTYKTTFGLLGAYFSADFDDEFIVGYTLNLLPGKKGRLWGLGVPFGVGRNNWENQLVLEAGLQLRFLLWEIRGTYRTIGFMDNSFILSAGWCIWKIDLEK